MLFRNVALISLALVAAASAAETSPTSDHVSSLLSQRRLPKEEDAAKADSKEKDNKKDDKKANNKNNNVGMDPSSLQINQQLSLLQENCGALGQPKQQPIRPIIVIDPNRESEDGAGDDAGMGVGVGAGEASSEGPACNLGTVVEVALGDMANFSSLVAALQAANFVEILKGDGPFTVFAPTNDAFNALPAGTVQSLFEEDGVPTLSNILLYHVVSGEVMSTDLSDGMMAETVEGSNIEISIDDAGVVMVNGATVTTANVPACNGVIHVIDSVLIPPADETGGDEAGADNMGGDDGAGMSENNQVAGPTGGAGTGGAGTGGGPSSNGSITGCAANVQSILAKGLRVPSTPTSDVVPTATVRRTAAS